jgi:hypothetical protein
MATLTPEQLAELRRRVARGQSPVTWDKLQVNAALQAVENYFEDVGRAAIGAAIEAAAPGVFGGPQKARIVAFWLWQKFRREGVS